MVIIGIDKIENIDYSKKRSLKLLKLCVASPFNSKQSEKLMRV